MKRTNALFVVAVLSLAGCSGRGAPQVRAGEPSVPPAASATPTWSAAAFVAAMKGATTKEGSAEINLTVQGTGPSDFTAEGQLNIGTPAAMRMHYDLPDGATTVLITGDKGFAQGPGIATGKWVPLVTSDVKAMAGQAGIEGYFAAFEAGGREVKYLGAESIDGTPTTKVAFEVDAKAGLAAQGKQVTKGMPGTITYLIWVDRDHLMRKAQVTIGPSTVITSMTWHTQHLVVEAPAADQIINSS